MAAVAQVAADLAALSPVAAAPPDETRSLAAPMLQPYTLLIGGPAKSGMTVNPRTAMSASSLFACVRCLSEDVAKLPFKVYRALPAGGKESLPAHPLSRLMNAAPNDEQTAFEFRQCLTAMAVLYGNGYAEVERNGAGVPVALWPLENWRVQPRRDPDGTLYYLVDGGTRFEQDDVLDIRFFTMTGIVGEMVTNRGKEAIGLALAAERFAAAYFGNGTRTSGYLKSKQALTAVAKDALKTGWRVQYTGVDNAFGTPLLEMDVDYVPMSNSPEQSQMLETREFAVEEVARWFRMPLHKIGHLERAQGWSTIEVANTDYVVDSLMPWFQRWEQECERKLVGTFEPEVSCEHLVAGLLRGDTAARYAAYNTAINIGLMNRDECRALENLNPIPGGYGATFYVPLNTKPIDVPYVPPARPTPPTPPAADPAKVEPPAVVEPATAAGANRGALTVMVAEAARHMVKVESERVARAAKQPGFAEWLDQFYAGQETHVRQKLDPVCRALGRADFNGVAYAAQSKAELRAAADGTGGTLADRVAVVLDRWKLERPAAIARQLTETK